MTHCLFYIAVQNAKVIENAEGARTTPSVVAFNPTDHTLIKPLIFSSIVLFLGNALYALAYDFNSIWILLIGRLLCG